ncbi:MAG: amidohydrolase family protein [Victivallales bacterium]|nr:amidohydrolase family protein [Victivallales bacterium]
MKVFDTHTHVFPDKIAAAALHHLQEMSHGIPVYTDGTYADHRAKALEAGQTAWMNCPVVTRPGQHVSLNRWAAEHNHWPSLSLGGLHPDDEDILGILHSIQDLGLCGIKLHPEYQQCTMLEPRMEPVWAGCEALGLPVLVHGGEDIGFEPPFHSSPKDYVEVLRRHPGLVLIAAHMGGWRNWDEVEHVLAGSEVYIDTSFAYPFFQDKSQFLRIIRKHGAKKVLFGTDSPWSDLGLAAREVAECGITPAESEDIFWDNAVRVWGWNAEFVK